MKRVAKTIGIVLGVIVLAFSFVEFHNDIGISKNSIEKEARTSSQINDNWQVAMDTSEIMSALVLYPEDKSDHTYQIYVNRPGLSFGYFFRGGGSNSIIENGIAEFSVDGYQDRAFVSLNKQQVIKAEIDDGNTIETIEVDRKKPFAIVLPKNVGSITFFDINHNTVEAMKEPL